MPTCGVPSDLSHTYAQVVIGHWARAGSPNVISQTVSGTWSLLKSGIDLWPQSCQSGGSGIRASTWPGAGTGGGDQPLGRVATSISFFHVVLPRSTLPSGWGNVW